MQVTCMFISALLCNTVHCLYSMTRLRLRDSREAAGTQQRKRANASYKPVATLTRRHDFPTCSRHAPVSRVAQDCSRNQRIAIETSERYLEQLTTDKYNCSLSEVTGSAPKTNYIHVSRALYHLVMRAMNEAKCGEDPLITLTIEKDSRFQRSVTLTQTTWLAMCE